MRVRQLRMRDYRGIPDLTLDFDDHLTVLVGPNGVGKSSVLGCLAVTLAPMVDHVAYGSGLRTIPGDADISNGRAQTDCTIGVAWEGQELEWQVTVERSPYEPIPTLPVEPPGQLVDRFRALFIDGKPTPVVVHYGVNRAAMELTWPPCGEGDVPRVAAYQGWYTGGRGDFGVFLGWFRDRHVLELERGQDEGRVYADPELDAVRSAKPRARPGVGAAGVAQGLCGMRHIRKGPAPPGLDHWRRDNAHLSIGRDDLGCIQDRM